MVATLSVRCELAPALGRDVGDDHVGGLENLVLDQAVRERLGHVAAADESELLHFGRSPKTARPTRTMVAPSSIATSKSSVMPIESSLSASPDCRRKAIAQLAQPREVRTRGLGASAWRRNRHQAVDFDLVARAASRSASTSSGATPVLLGSPPRFTSISTWHTRRRLRTRNRVGQARGIERLNELEGARRESSPCCSADGRSDAIAFGQVRQLGALRDCLLHVVLAEVARARLICGANRLARLRLAREHEPNRRGVAPSACKRPRAMRSRTSSAARSMCMVNRHFRAITRLHAVSRERRDHVARSAGPSRCRAILRRAR